MCIQQHAQILACKLHYTAIISRVFLLNVYVCIVDCCIPSIPSNFKTYAAPSSRCECVQHCTSMRLSQMAARTGMGPDEFPADHIMPLFEAMGGMPPPWWVCCRVQSIRALAWVLLIAACSRCSAHKLVSDAVFTSILIDLQSKISGLLPAIGLSQMLRPARSSLMPDSSTC